MRYRSLLTALLAFAVCLGWSAALCAGSGPEDRRQSRRQRPADKPAPKSGQAAPLLKLKTLDGEQEVDLAGFGGKRPVLLLFGSYT
ncbi:MAG: hypothetical protein ACYSUQ_05425 [Planctomycetota bacterium]|jgi:hypothetical protein